MNIRRILLAALLAVLCLPSSSMAAAAPTWRMVTTPHFRVVSQANEHQTLSWVRNYEQFISTTAKALGIKPDALPPLTIVLFARDKEYTPYKITRADGKAAKVAGQFMRMAGLSAIATAADAEQSAARRTIYHEGTHWLMSVDVNRHPTWFAEGIAEMLSTFELSGSKVNWAKPIDSHLKQLQGNGLLPLKDFLARTDALQDQNRDDDRYYAQSWAFVHFLMLSQPSRVEMLDRILAESRTLSSEMAVNKVIGADLAMVERDLGRYVHQTSFSFVSHAAEPGRELPASVPAPPALVEGALGFLALSIGKHDLAQQHARRAVELDNTLPDGHEVLALLARQNKDEAGVREHAQAAVRADSRSSEMYLLLADSLARERSGGIQAASAARLPLLKKAIALNPGDRRAYRQLAYDLMSYETPAAEDLLALEPALRRFPDDDWVAVGAAAARSRLGGGSDALQAVQAALRPQGSLTADERRIVTALRRNLLMQSLEKELAGAQQQNDIAAARAIIARHLQLAGDDEEIAGLMRRRDSSFELALLVERMNAGLRAGRSAELDLILEQILAHPLVSAELRNFVENTRQRMR